MAIDFQEVGQRLRAYRLGTRLSIDEVATRLGVSRAALYRYEKGAVMKITTLERLAELLSVSVPTLLGVGAEYTANATSFFERLRQLEEDCDQIIVLFGPTSYLLTSEEYDRVLPAVMLESIPPCVKDRARAKAENNDLMKVLRERKDAYRRNPPSIVNIVATNEISRFLHHGLVGTPDLPEKVVAERRASARREVEHILNLVESPPMGVQIGLVHDSMPTTSFQILRRKQKSHVAMSSFRIGEQPNLRVGVAMITSAPDALQLHTSLAEELWSRSLKGSAAGKVFGKLLADA